MMPDVKEMTRMLTMPPDMGDKALLRIAKGWLVLGLVGTAILSVFAVAVFGFRVTVHNRYSGAVVSPADTLKLLLFMVPIFVLFAAAGALVSFGIRRHRCQLARKRDPGEAACAGSP
jgi:hypothetical protein